ncbi:type II secretion system protein GspG [Maribacter litoralis]|uniref:General secretion pathway protein G n=1 Tax=Maribacter litoralis TaxID=2059726 RepID=A0A653TIR5_9FLAO|nr:type II secretion system protein GspG [Maribacter litoralis]VXB75753.1 General secretion pathway protein G [Maribacter litoralis]
MIETILSILVDFGLLREDYLHKKRIRKKEEHDGKKRPFQNYLFQPSLIIFCILIFVTSISSVLFFTYHSTTIIPKNTQNEILEIRERVENYKETLGYYPKELNDLIRNNPLRQKWKTDGWNRPYSYIIIENGNNFLITSLGPDGKLGTKDDINSK